MFWTCTQEMLSSNFGQDNGYLKNSVMILSAFRQVSWAQETTNESFQIISNSSFTNHLTISTTQPEIRLCPTINHMEKTAITIRQICELLKWHKHQQYLLHLITDLWKRNNIWTALVIKKWNYEGCTESHEQLFFACKLGTADKGECSGRWNQLLCYP